MTFSATRRAMLQVSCLVLVVAFASGAAEAARLEVAADAPVWAHLGANALLVLHIGGGTLGLVAGTVASFTRKGGAAHRLWGRLFLAGMFLTYLIGAGVAPFLEEGRRPNFIAGILALYLLLSGTSAARRRPFRAGVVERIGLAAAILITGIGLSFMIMGAMSETGTVDDSPPQAFIVFVLAAGAAAVGDLRVLIVRSLPNAERISRHLWRMCASFFFASGSLFFGQPQLFPAWWPGSIPQFLLSFAPLFIMAGFIAKAKLEMRRA